MRAKTCCTVSPNGRTVSLRMVNSRWRCHPSTKRLSAPYQAVIDTAQAGWCVQVGHEGLTKWSHRLPTYFDHEAGTSHVEPAGPPR